MRKSTRPLLSLLTAPLVALSLVGAPAQSAEPYAESANGSDLVSTTNHVRLGGSISYPYDLVAGGEESCGYFSWDFLLEGTVDVEVALGADLTMSYSRADLLPGASIPIDLSYVPTDDGGPEFSLDVGSDVLSLTTSPINLWGPPSQSVSCALALPLATLLAAAFPLDLTQTDFSFGGGAASGIPPLAGDPSITVPTTSGSTLVVFVTVAGGDHDLIRINQESSVTVSPAGSGDITGLGGAATVATVEGGATLDGTYPGVEVLEWQNAGSSQVITLDLGSDPSAEVDVVLGPLLHWVETAADIQLSVDYIGLFDLLFQDTSYDIVSGSLGPVYEDVAERIETEIGDRIGSDPGVTDRVREGYLPIPLTDPELAAVESNLTLGSVRFALDPDADGDGLWDGEEIQLGTDPDLADTDGDGLPDGEELDAAAGAGCPDPLKRDSDDDTLLDGNELTAGTDPCSADTDGDGLRDDVDPYPTDPRTTQERLEQAALDVAARIRTLDRELFTGPNERVNEVRRTLLADRVRFASQAIAVGDYRRAVTALGFTFGRIDEQPRPPDWMTNSEAKTELADSVRELIVQVEAELAL